MKLKERYPFYLANKARTSEQLLSVIDKYTQNEITQVALASESCIDTALSAAVASRWAMRRLRPFERHGILMQCLAAFRARAEEFAHVLCLEAGKPMRDSEAEVERLIDTFQIAAEESLRINGEVLNLEISPRAAGYRGFDRKYGIGPCSFITPFNFPLNLVAHKVAPAIAAGCPFILKPASATPLGALLIGEVLAETDLPEGAFSILPCSRASAERFTVDERLKLLSFTGSPDVGWDLKARAGKKKVVLELGGNAACIVDSDASLERAAERICLGAFSQSGQSCISVQRVFVQESVYDSFREHVLEKSRSFTTGDPKKASTRLGPMISSKEAQRVEQWIEQAVAGGARILTGGMRDGVFVEATVLENVNPECKVSAEEVFGPVMVLSPFTDFGACLQAVNESRFGLQAGIFTRDIEKMFCAWDELEVGGVIVNDVPSWRVDSMPYGGVKDSGFGREGVRYAIEDMSERRLLVVADGSWG